MPKINQSLDKEVMRHVLREQREKLERIKIDIVFIREKLGMTSTNVMRLKDLNNDFRLIQNFIDFLESKL